MGKGIKVTVLLSIVFAGIGILFGGLDSSGYTLRTIILYGLIGAFLGAVGAPVIEPKYFQYPTAWQVFFAIIGCLLFAFSLHSTLIGYFIAILVGVVLGLTARFWVKYVVFP